MSTWVTFLVANLNNRNGKATAAISVVKINVFDSKIVQFVHFGNWYIVKCIRSTIVVLEIEIGVFDNP